MKLVKYEQARRALEVCVKVDDAKDIMDKMEALRAYARQRNDRDMEHWTAEIKLRAARRIGEISDGLDKLRGGRPSKTPPGAGGVSKQEVLAAAGVTQQDASRCEQIKSIPDAKFEKFFAACRADDKPPTIDLAISTVVREQKKGEAIADLRRKAKIEVTAPTGFYDVIVIDPPWPIQKIERDCRPNQTMLDYPTMSVEEISKLKIPAAKTCHVWLWTTHRFLPDALEIGKQWNLKYCCTFVWHKPGGFQPVGLPQYNCEFALYFRKGSPIFASTKKFPVCFDAPRGKHSEKPEEFYETIRGATEGRRLDMFSRRAIEGFTPWGQESPEQNGDE